MKNRPGFGRYSAAVRQFPKQVVLSGVAQSLINNALAGMAGVLFLIFGFAKDNAMLKIVGALAIVFYLVTSLTNTRGQLSKVANQLSEKEFNKMMKEVLRTQKQSATTYFEKFTHLAESKLSSVKDAAAQTVRKNKENHHED